MEGYEKILYEGETGEKFSRFYDLLEEWNAKFNLTGIRGREECYIKNFEDSLLGEKFFPPGAVCAEVGSGGGGPSVPPMIAPPRSLLHADRVGEQKMRLSPRRRKGTFAERGSGVRQGGRAGKG